MTCLDAQLGIKLQNLPVRFFMNEMITLGLSPSFSVSTISLGSCDVVSATAFIKGAKIVTCSKRYKKMKSHTLSVVCLDYRQTNCKSKLSLWFIIVSEMICNRKLVCTLFSCKHNKRSTCFRRLMSPLPLWLSAFRVIRTSRWNESHTCSPGDTLSPLCARHGSSHGWCHAEWGIVLAQRLYFLLSLTARISCRCDV